MNNPNITKKGSKVNREFIINNFNWEIHAEKLYQIYRELTNK